jgi:hypothetical protein
MKILKWLLGILAVLAVAFFLIGVFIPTFTYETQIVVDRPTEHAFAVFADESKLADWMTGFKSIETISGYANEIGSQYRLIFEEEGEVMEMIETVTAFEQNKLFAVKLVNDLMYVDTEIEFTEEMGKTKIAACPIWSKAAISSGSRCSPYLSPIWRVGPSKSTKI